MERNLPHYRLLQLGAPHQRQPQSQATDEPRREASPQMRMG